MPKQKTHKGAKKRFRVTANGKVLHKLAGTRHRQVRMSQKRKRKLRGTGVLGQPAEAKTIIGLLGKYSY